MSDSHQMLQAASETMATRRTFLRRTAALAGASGLAGLASRPARGQVAAANERLGVGFIGVGGRGMHHVRTVQAMIGAGEALEIVAVSDTYGPRMRAAAEQASAKPYRDYRELLADPAVDVVCIATPDRLHVPQALDAIRAGKDVYCEKPMGHWTQFALSRELFRETRRLERVVQIGNQGNSSSFWPRVRDLIGAGAIGRVQHVQAGFYRFGDWGERMPIPDPNARPGPDVDWDGFLGDAPKVPFTVERFFSWRMFLDYAGGPCTDLFPHMYTPFVNGLGLTFPARAAATGGIFRFDDYGREVPDTFSLCLDFPQKLTVVLVCTLTNDYLTEPAIRGDEGTITLQGVVWEQGCNSITIHRRGKDPEVIAGEKPDSTRAHWQNLLHCVRTREKPVSDVGFGYQVQTALCMGMLAFLNDKVAHFDPAREEIVL